MNTQICVKKLWKLCSLKLGQNIEILLKGYARWVIHIDTSILSMVCHGTLYCITESILTCVIRRCKIASDLFVWCSVIYLEDQLNIAIFFFFLVTIVTGHECTGISYLSRIICCISSTVKYPFLTIVRTYSDLTLYDLELCLSIFLVFLVAFFFSGPQCPFLFICLQLGRTQHCSFNFDFLQNFQLPLLFFALGMQLLSSWNQNYKHLLKTSYPGLIFT